MIDKRKETKGITLIEVMIVAAIVVVLLGVLWLAVGPSVKRKALETRVFSDLRQIAAAYNIYVSENDGKYPYSMASLPKTLPQGLPGENHYGALAPFHYGPRIYFLCHSQLDEDDMDRLGSTLRWDPATDGIVDASFIERITGKKIMGRLYGPNGFYRMIEQDEFFIPSVRVDGSCYWMCYPENWKNELMARRAFQGNQGQKQ